MNTPKTVLIVDGHAGVRTALADALGHAPGLQVVGAVDNLDTALQVARARAPDVVIYDPGTVRGDAAVAVARLGARGRRVVVLTAVLHAGAADVLWRAGVTAILLKGRTLATLLYGIHTILEERGGLPQARDLDEDERRRLRTLALRDQFKAALAEAQGGSSAPARSSNLVVPEPYNRAISPLPSPAPLAPPRAGAHLLPLLARSAVLVAQARNLLDHSRILYARAQRVCAQAAALHHPPRHLTDE